MCRGSFEASVRLSILFSPTLKLYVFNAQQLTVLLARADQIVPTRVVGIPIALVAKKEKATSGHIRTYSLVFTKFPRGMVATRIPDLHK